MSERILLVDDEPAVLDGYRRLLHKEFDIQTAVGAGDALEAVAVTREDPFAVIVSDLRMPEMDGVQFLARVRVVSPDTVRIALTGQADINTAVSAVNEGSLFRFLTKPCPKEVLAKALTAGLLQYRLVTAEKELLEKTLHGSITVLTEVLSLVNPAAFRRAIRIRRYVQHVVKKLQLEGAWRFDVAAMMSQLGCVTLDTETLEAIYAGQSLSAEEQLRVDAHPGVAAKLLSNIPRLEPVARMIAQQDSILASKPTAKKVPPDAVALGAQILKVALSYDQLRNGRNSHQESLSRLRLRPDQFERTVVDALEDLEMDEHRVEVKSCRIQDLECDMILQEDVRTQNGLLVVAKGQTITYPLLIRLRNFWQRKAIAPEIVVHIPRGAVEDQPAKEAETAKAATAQ
jgi:response regulator RpfG family c-di-GMP phosphodiesterase